ncbi:hypothetical protein BDZ89DRAFT_1147948 [Hymenopellis radicata]|nr:hypothetical protein BDZ89DRAFT_1147948 [Hymenopellis radicata]
MTDSQDSTLVAAFVGVVVAACLLGATYGQIAYYFLHQRDAWPHHTLVIAVTTFDTTHQALIAYTVYSYLIPGGQAITGRPVTIWSLLLEVIFNGIITFLVQGYLTRRIWSFSNRSWWIAVFVIPLIFLEFGSVLAFAIYCLAKVHTAEELGKIKNFYIMINALSAGADILIAAVSTGLLIRARTGYPSTERMIRCLVVMSINVGALTALCALGSLVSILAWGRSFNSA